jgi:hypothetical protein
MATQKKLRFFLDTEFNEHAARNTLDPISIALVPEDEAQPNFYGVSSEYNAEKITPWLEENVIKHLPPTDQRKSNDDIRDAMIEYLKGFSGQGATSVEIWAYNGSTDNVVIANFFGGLLNMRQAFNEAGLPRPEFREIKELARATGGQKLPPPENAHDSLQDTLWTRAMFKHLVPKLKRSQKFLVD